MEWQINQEQEPEVPDFNIDEDRLRSSLRLHEATIFFVYNDKLPASNNDFKYHPVRHKNTKANWTLGVGHLMENPISEPTSDLS